MESAFNKIRFKITAIFIFAACSYSQLTYAQPDSIKWVNKILNNINYVIPDMDVMNDGSSVITTEYFNFYTINYDTTFHPSALLNILIQKFDPNGDSSWALIIDNVILLNSPFLNINKTTNDIYISFIIDSVTTYNGNNIWGLTIMKFNSSGSLIWTRSISNNSESYLYESSMDENGNLYLNGKCNMITGLFPGCSISSSGLNDNYFVAKFDPNGNCTWVKTYKAHATYKMISSVNSVYLTGIYSDSCDIGSYHNYITGGFDYFFCRLDENSNLKWIYTNGVPTETYPYGITQFDNKVVLTGIYRNSVDIGNITLTSAKSDIFVCAFDSSGNNLWDKSFSGTNSHVSRSIEQIGNFLYISGFIGDTANFDSITVISGSSDSFIARLNKNNGDCDWVYTAKGNFLNEIMDMKSDSYNNVYFMGRMWGGYVLLGEDSIVHVDDSVHTASFIGKFEDINFSGSVFEFVNNTNIFPNPFNDEIIIESSFFSEKSFYKIFNLMGETVKCGFTRSNHEHVDVSDLKDGIYIINISSEKIRTSRKLLKSAN